MMPIVGKGSFMVSLSNHEALAPLPCDALLVRQAHHEGFDRLGKPRTVAREAA